MQSSCISCLMFVQESFFYGRLDGKGRCQSQLCSKGPEEVLEVCRVYYRGILEASYKCLPFTIVGNISELTVFFDPVSLSQFGVFVSCSVQCPAP